MSQVQNCGQSTTSSWTPSTLVRLSYVPMEHARDMTMELACSTPSKIGGYWLQDHWNGARRNNFRSLEKKQKIRQRYSMHNPPRLRSGDVISARFPFSFISIYRLCDLGTNFLNGFFLLEALQRPVVQKQQGKRKGHQHGFCHKHALFRIIHVDENPPKSALAVPASQLHIGRKLVRCES